MSKDAIIDIPCLQLDLTPRELGEVPKLKLHLIPVPEEALVEVQEVLKKFQPEYDKLNKAFKKAQNVEG